MKIAIVLNSLRLTPELSAKLQDGSLTQTYGITYDLFTPPPEDLCSTLEKLNYAAYNAILVGGGDGTIRTAVQYIYNKDTPLAILPLGTFNVLAKSLDYTNDIEKIFAIIKNNKTKKIDLAQVNEQIIVNHAWLGYYYYILKLRKRHRDIVGKSRLLKAIFNTFIMFKQLPFYHFDVKIHEKVVSYKTCLLFVSNNETAANLFNFGERKTLAAGLLSVDIIHAHTRWQLFFCMIEMMFKPLKNSSYAVHFSVEELKVAGTKDILNTVIDGELFKLEAPLHFKILSKQLTVFTL